MRQPTNTHQKTKKKTKVFKTELVFQLLPTAIVETNVVKQLWAGEIPKQSKPE